MFASLTGLGLASAAGLNAYIPLLVVGLIARYTDLIPLAPAWAWIEHPITLICVSVLLIVEFAADKVPALDSVNDVLQTFVRPTSGGITFGAGASALRLNEITEISGEASGAAATSGGGIVWGAVIAGTIVALFFHLAKALARPVINVFTAGIGAPVVSFLEDVVSVFTALLAVLLPLLIVIVFPLMVVVGVWGVRKGRKVRAERRAQRSGQYPGQRFDQQPGSAPGQWLNPAPGQRPGSAPEQRPGSAPGQQPGSAPGQWLNSAPAQGTWKDLFNGRGQRKPW